jgi:hypothetical protein
MRRGWAVNRIIAMMNMIKSRRWPTIKNSAGFYVDGVIKKSSVREILEISAESEDRGAKSFPRPEWLRENANIIHDIFVVVLVVDSYGFIRCSVISVLEDGVGFHLAMDVMTDRFDRMEDANYAEVVDLAHRYLKGFKSLPPDSPIEG